MKEEERYELRHVLFKDLPLVPKGPSGGSRVTICISGEVPKANHYTILCEVYLNFQIVSF